MIGVVLVNMSDLQLQDGLSDIPGSWGMIVLLISIFQDLGVLVWDNNNKRVMVVSRAGHDTVKKYWKQLKQSNT